MPVRQEENPESGVSEAKPRKKCVKKKKSIDNVKNLSKAE